MRAICSLTVALCFLPGLTLPAKAQRPTLFTESPSTAGKGRLSAGVGVEYLKKNKVTPLRAPSSLWRFPVTRNYFGVGEIVDVVLDWRGRLFAEQGTGRRVSDWGDISLGTKIRLLREKRSHPALGILYLVKLPNTSRDDLLGSNATDFFLSFLASKTFTEFELRGNLGLGILDDPENPHSQLDIYTMSFACTFPVGSRQQLLLEWAGFLGPHRDQAKFLARYGFEVSVARMTWAVFGSLRIIGDEKDFGTAFEYSESWGVGILVRKEFKLW